ncbi:MAG TPA: alpha/beta fold hydrolase [Acidobacteriaceae bacterium]|jgi:dipeptidyl-peptidase-4|nr:alpha/beta fold hydrolase [Acidobacteriaceae bacterium]
MIWLLASIPGMAMAQNVIHGGGKPLSIADLFQQHGGPTGEPPQEYLWSPDGSRATYLSSDTEHGQPDDVISVQSTTGTASVLVDRDKIASLYSQANDERDLDHRSRYGQSSYFWSSDGKHLLFDATGQLWLYDLGSKTGVLLANTGAGSGDDPKFSPDGKMISFVRDHNLHILRLTDNQDVPLTSTDKSTLLNGEVDWVYEEELDVRSNYFWSPNSKHVAYLQMDEADVPQYPLTDWMPLHSKVDQQRYPQPGDSNPGVRVGIVGANGGHTFWLRLPISENNDYIPRLGWLDNKTLWLELLHRDQKHIELYFADIESGEVRPVLSETANRFFDASYNVRFLPNGKLLWSSWRDGYTHLYLYSYNQKHPLQSDAKLERQLTSGSWDVLSVPCVDKKNGIVYYTSNETDPREEMLWQVKLDGTGKKMLSTMHGVHKISFDPTGAHYVDTASSLMQPQTASICSVKGDCTPFWKPHPLDGYTLVAPKMIISKASDGTVLYGTLLLPPDMNRTASVPLILNPYGGPYAQTVRDGWSPGLLFDEVLMQHGFAVLHVDNRGMGHRGRVFAEAAYHDFGPVQLEDQLSVLDQVLAQYPQLDPKRLGWWGWSWGGTFTLYAMTHSDRFAAGVAVAPVTNWRLYDSIYTERYMGEPKDNVQGYKDDSVINSAADLHGHLLIAHGTGDDNVHMQNSIQFIQKLINADKQYDLLLYPQLTHSLDTPAARTQLFERILLHFQTYLQPATAQ